jgi:hypothetical protein
MMPSQLLINPEAHGGGGRRLTEERLYRLDCEKFDIINQQFKGKLEGNILLGWCPWRFGNAGSCRALLRSGPRGKIIGV